MKVISIIEPWASLIKDNIKFIETRSWKTTYRGEIYIHASLKKVSKNDKRIDELIALLKNKNFKYGHIIAKATLIDCIYMDNEFIKKIKNNKTEYITPLNTPIPVKGKLGIWNYEE